HSSTSGDHAHNVGLLHDQEVLAVELDFGAGPFAEQHPVAGLDVGFDDLAGLVATTGPHRDDLALRGLLLGGSGIMMPPLDFSSASIRFTTTRSCRGRNLVLAMKSPHKALAGLWSLIDTLDLSGC